MYGSDEKNSSRICNSEYDDNEYILKSSEKHPSQLNDSQSQDYKVEGTLSPKFMSLRKDKEVEEEQPDVEEDEIHAQTQVIKKTSQFSEQDHVNFSRDHINRKSIEKNRKNASSTFKPEESDKELDYKEKLRQSLETGSKKVSSVQINTSNEQDDILGPEPDNSDYDTDSYHKPEYLMSPLSQNYEDFEEFRNNYKKKQQEMLDELNSMSVLTSNILPEEMHSEHEKDPTQAQ